MLLWYFYQYLDASGKHIAAFLNEYDNTKLMSYDKYLTGVWQHN